MFTNDDFELFMNVIAFAENEGEITDSEANHLEVWVRVLQFERGVWSDGAL